jgi:N6-adenosine-specific RNA methylase IME4
MDRSVNDIIVRGRHRKQLGDLTELAESMARHGLLHPIVITSDNRLIAGQRRLEAAKLLGWNRIPVHVVDVANKVHAEADENIIRLDFTPSERVAVAKTIEAEERRAAKERIRTQRPPGKSPGGREATTARTRIAKRVGTSYQTLERAREVVAAAKEEPEKYGYLVDKMDRSGSVSAAHRELIVKQKADAIRRNPPQLPTGKYEAIVADPPWHYPTGGEYALPYPSMSLDEIKALDVGSLAEKDCVLWLWTTNAYLRDAFDVVDAWGFEYKNVMTWVKDRFGLGAWLRNQTEHCLLAVRGKPIWRADNWSTVLTASRRTHSQKPEEFYRMVEELCPGAKVELFCRDPRPGWAVHGDEVSPSGIARQTLIASGAKTKGRS